MNGQRLQKLKEIILIKRHDPRSLYSGFNMNRYFTPCGTPQCICGWAIHSFADEETNRDAKVSHRTGKYGAELLDLDYEIADELFIPMTAVPYTETTPQQAAQAIQNVLDFGEPRWSDILHGE